jgi:dCTP deaminase
MILTGAAIREAVKNGEIVIEPFDDRAVNPNSYNYRLGDTLVHFGHGAAFRFDRCGYVLLPGNLYLGHTKEILGSRKYAMTLLGRSSTGRLGLFVNINADLGHVGSMGQWTLELSVVQPLRVYPGCRIGQIAFWETIGRSVAYTGRYSLDLGPVANRDTSLERESPDSLQIRVAREER